MTADKMEDTDPAHMKNAPVIAMQANTSLTILVILNQRTPLRIPTCVNINKTPRHGEELIVTDEHILLVTAEKVSPRHIACVILYALGVGASRMSSLPYIDRGTAMEVHGAPSDAKLFWTSPASDLPAEVRVTELTAKAKTKALYDYDAFEAVGADIFQGRRTHIVSIVPSSREVDVEKAVVALRQLSGEKSVAWFDNDNRWLSPLGV